MKEEKGSSQESSDAAVYASLLVRPERLSRDRAVYWRCFHCGATFTQKQERWAREHFGDDMGDLPVCQMRLPGEHFLLTALRKAQRELRRFYAEDTDLIRAIYAMRADHADALRREEERGYEKGLADGRALIDEANSLGRRAIFGLARVRGMLEEGVRHAAILRSESVYVPAIMAREFIALAKSLEDEDVARGAITSSEEQPLGAEGSEAAALPGMNP